MSRFQRVALCGGCWGARYPEKIPVRTNAGETEICHGCGNVTRSGIYIRTDVDAEPAAQTDSRQPLVSSVVVHTEGAHEAVNVWLRGAHVGKLLVGKGQGEPLRNLLLLEHSRVGQEIIGARQPSRSPDEWLIKDFNVLYRAAWAAMTAEPDARGNVDEALFDALGAQLLRLKPAFDLTEGVRAAARETGRIEPPSDEALANYEATKKAGEGD